MENLSSDEKFHTVWKVNLKLNLIVKRNNNVILKVYKTNVIGQFKPLKPTFERIRIGGWGVAREGSLLIELAASSNSGPVRRVDWGNKLALFYILILNFN